MLALLLIPLAHADTCQQWAPPDHGSLRDAPMINESSGVAPSLRDPDVYYTVNDSGGRAEAYAFRADGRFLGASPITGATNIDWEAIATGPCPSGPQPCLYVGDIGDNDKARDHVTVYVLAEPTPGRAQPLLATWTLRYPDKPHNAETLLVHPISGEISVITKSGKGHSAVYRVPPNGSGTLQRVASIEIRDWADSTSRKITGGDFDHDGDRLVIRTYTQAWEWAVDPCHPDAHWATTPQRVDTGRHIQAEAITYTADGDLLTTSEGAPMRITRVGCAQPVTAPTPCSPPETP